MTGAGMRFTEVRREAARNIATGTSRAVLLAALIAVVSGVLAGLDAIAMNGVITRADEFRERGASITRAQIQHELGVRQDAESAALPLVFGVVETLRAQCVHDRGAAEDA